MVLYGVSMDGLLYLFRFSPLAPGRGTMPGPACRVLHGNLIYLPNIGYEDQTNVPKVGLHFCVSDDHRVWRTVFKGRQKIIRLLSLPWPEHLWWQRLLLWIHTETSGVLSCAPL